MRFMLDATPHFKVGDPCPEGYIARQDWAMVHYKQEQCSHCMMWRFPHELSDSIIKSVAYKDRAMTKPVIIESRICLECERRLSADVAASTLSGENKTEPME